MAEREHWNSRLGLIFAMAGNAVGLGNFLRFPVQAANNGGGAFMIPYFLAFVLLAIPLMWVEWSIGRRGGQYGHGSLPGMFDTLTKSKAAKYFGAVGILISTLVMVYYVYIISWTLGFSFFSIIGTFNDFNSLDTMKTFLYSYQGIGEGYFTSQWPAYIFLLVTLAINFYILSKGISGGIEKFATIAVPLLIGFGIVLVVWVFFLGTPNPDLPEFSTYVGINYIWEPNFSMLKDADIWLAAAGQVFFTLSVGMGTLQAYASYLDKDDDIALSGLATSGINEFSEVILGSMIAIPIATAFFGLAMTQTIAEGGAFDLGIIAMASIFTEIPFGNILSFIWFFLLFIAGVTSSVAMAQPLISFLQEQFRFNRRKSTFAVGLFIFIAVHFVFLYMDHGFLDELDYWAGTFGLVIISLFEVILFAWVFGMDKGWEEINRGSDIKIPRAFYYIIKYVTPAYLLFILIFWIKDKAYNVFLMDQVDKSEILYRWGARGFILILLLALCGMIWLAWKRNNGKPYTEEEIEGVE